MLFVWNLSCCASKQLAFNRCIHVFEGNSATLIRCMQCAFHKVQWLHISGVGDRNKITYVKFLPNSVQWISLRSVGFWPSYFKNTRWTFLVHSLHGKPPLHVDYQSVCVSAEQHLSVINTQARCRRRRRRRCCCCCCCMANVGLL